METFFGVTFERDVSPLKPTYEEWKRAVPGLPSRFCLLLKPTYEEWKRDCHNDLAARKFLLKPTYEEWKPPMLITQNGLETVKAYL